MVGTASGLIDPADRTAPEFPVRHYPVLNWQIAPQHHRELLKGNGQIEPSTSVRVTRVLVAVSTSRLTGFRRMGESMRTRRVIRVALLLILDSCRLGLRLGSGPLPMAAILFHWSAYKTVRPSVPTVPLSAYEMRAPILAAFPPKGRIAMVGALRSTEFAPWSGMFPDEDIANYGISGDTVDGVLARVPSILASHAKKMLVMIGINDLRNGQVGEFDHSDISHTRGGPWGQRRAGLGRIHVMHVRQRPKHARV